MRAKFLHKTRAELEAMNPILLDGEPVFERDSKMIKVGDGKTPYNYLPPYSDTSMSMPRLRLSYRSDIGLCYYADPEAFRSLKSLHPEVVLMYRKTKKGSSGAAGTSNSLEGSSRWREKNQVSASSIKGGISVLGEGENTLKNNLHIDTCNSNVKYLNTLKTVNGMICTATNLKNVLTVTLLGTNQKYIAVNGKLKKIPTLESIQEKTKKGALIRGLFGLAIKTKNSIKTGMPGTDITVCQYNLPTLFEFGVHYKVRNSIVEEKPYIRIL